MIHDPKNGEKSKTGEEDSIYPQMHGKIFNPTRVKGMGMNTVAGFTHIIDKLKYLTRPATITLGKAPPRAFRQACWRPRLGGR